MSESAKDVRLPDFDITDEEMARASSCTGIDDWTPRQLKDGYRDILTKAYCRSRQLLSALKSLAQKDARIAELESYRSRDRIAELEAALAAEKARHDARSLGEARGYGKPTSCGSLQGHKGLGE